MFGLVSSDIDRSSSHWGAMTGARLSPPPPPWEPRGYIRIKINFGPPNDNPITKAEIPKEDESSLTEEEPCKQEKIRLLICRPLYNTLLVNILWIDINGSMD